MKKSLFTLFIISSLFAASQTPIIYTGQIDQNPSADTLSAYGSYITAADEGGFFIAPHAYDRDNFPVEGLYFVFPNDSHYLASDDFAPYKIEIAPPANDTVTDRFGALILEMDNYLLVADTAYDVVYPPAAPLVRLFPRVFLYEEKHDSNGVSWEYTGKKYTHFHGYTFKDLEKISETEIALSNEDNIQIFDFNSGSPNFMTLRQTIEPEHSSYSFAHAMSIEAMGENLLLISRPLDSTFNILKHDSKGGIFVYKRNPTTQLFEPISKVVRTGDRSDPIGQRMEVTWVNGDTLLLASASSWNQVNPNQIILFKLQGNELIPQDSLGINRYIGLNFAYPHNTIIDIDANHGKFFFLQEDDKTYAASNLSYGTVKVFSPIEINGKYELNWTETILPPAGAVGDTNIISGSVAIGNKLETSQPSTTWTYAWAVGMDKLNSSNGSPRVGGWLTPWSNSSNNIAINEFDTPSIEVYPNPAQDYFIISGEDLNEADAIFLSDLNGRILRNIPVTSIETVVKREDLDSGIYLVQIQFGQIVLNQKVIFE